MQIQRIEVRAFRKLNHRVVAGLGPGLNVLVGDNEAGKSTLLAALRAVLFERHRVGGKVVAAMLPHGREVRPEVTLDFTLQGHAYRLRKAFNQRPEAELTMPGGQCITGDAVEERMAELLGFQAPGTRGSKPDEHQGIYGLLWVDQGLAHGPLNAGAGQNSLSSALESEVGQVLGGERGRHLLVLAEERRDQFWTKLDKARGPLKALQDQVADLQAEQLVLQERLGHYDQQVAALANTTEILARHARDDRLAVAVRAVEAARRAAAESAQLEATVIELRRAQAGATVASEAATERLAARQALANKAAAAALALTRTAEALQEGQETLQRATEAARVAAEDLRALREGRQAVDARLEAHDKRIARRQARDELARVQRTLDEADRLAVQRRAAAEVAARISITAAALADLDKRCAARDLARSRRDAASVQITVEAARAGTIAVDGVPHPAAEPLLLSRDAVLDLSGFGRLRLRPGGGVEALARALDEAETMVDATLRRLGQPSREAAAEALARKGEAEAEIAAQDRLFAILAPEGLDVLRETVAKLAAEAGDLTDPDLVASETMEDRGSLRQARAAGQLAEAGAEAEVKRLDAAREAAARHVAVLGERAAAAEREQAASLHALSSARDATSDDRLAGAQAQAQATEARTAAASAAAEAALAAADPDTIALELRRAEQAEAAIRADIDTLTMAKFALEVELRTLGQDGLGEQLADLEGRIAAGRQRLAALALEAEASLLLYRTLTSAQRETKDRWLGPVRERVRPYLKLIQPGSDIVLNEKTFGIEHLVRDGISEPFDSLSVGAREQVAVITRLALADILRVSGQPSAIILDDALVNTDETRLGAMHLVLQKAAEHLQVLVLTCREKDFVALGAPIHRL